MGAEEHLRTLPRCRRAAASAWARCGSGTAGVLGVGGALWLAAAAIVAVSAAVLLVPSVWTVGRRPAGTTMAAS